MYNRVLVPLDGSELARQALPYGELVARAFGVKVDLIRAVPSMADVMQGVAASGAERWPAYPEWEKARERFRDLARDDLAQTQLASGPETHGNLIVADGQPAQAIADEAARVPGTLIAMTTHGRSGINRWWLGSVTDKLVQTGASPVLVVRAKDESAGAATPKLSNIILPLDGSPLSEEAIPHAMAMAKALGTGVILVRTVEPVVFSTGEGPFYGQLVDHLVEDADAYLEEQASSLRKAGVAPVHKVVEVGYAAHVVLNLLDETADKLVIMATHGRSGLGRLMLGSVTDRVVRGASGPVLVVPVRSREE